MLLLLFPLCAPAESPHLRYLKEQYEKIKMKKWPNLPSMMKSWPCYEQIEQFRTYLQAWCQEYRVNHSQAYEQHMANVARMRAGWNGQTEP
jgi:hypothetical protein